MLKEFLNVISCLPYFDKTEGKSLVLQTYHCFYLHHDISDESVLFIVSERDEELI